MAAKRARKGSADSAGRGGKCVIEGVPPLEVGSSALAALWSALRAMGSEVPLETLLVSGGAAFVLHVQTDRMHHAGQADARPLAGIRIASAWMAAENLIESTCAALGVEAQVVALEKEPAATRLKALWRDIERSVRDGRPVPACGMAGSFEHEWCLVTGVDSDADTVFFRDATHRLESYARGPRGGAWRGWMPGCDVEVHVPHVLIAGLPRRKPAEQRLADLAVERAVAGARQGMLPPSWASGLAAYQVWILQLGQDAWHAEAAHHLREPALATAWLLSNTFAGRRAAGIFFEQSARLYAGKKNAAVHRAAKLYSASAGALHTAMGLFPNWGQGYEEAERRHKAIELLTIAETAEREAVEHLEEAFGL